MRAATAAPGSGTLSMTAPEPVRITPFELAQRFVGVSEAPGAVAHPQILAMLRLDSEWPKDDEVPWCSAFVNYIAWLLRLPRSKALNARSWLSVGAPIALADAAAGFDICVFWRGSKDGPQGHVAFFAGLESDGIAQRLHVLGGNQGDRVSVAEYPVARLLGIRRLATA